MLDTDLKIPGPPPKEDPPVVEEVSRPEYSYCSISITTNSQTRTFCAGSVSKCLELYNGAMGRERDRQGEGHE